MEEVVLMEEEVAGTKSRGRGEGKRASRVSLAPSSQVSAITLRIHATTTQSGTRREREAIDTEATLALLGRVERYFERRGVPARRETVPIHISSQVLPHTSLYATVEYTQENVSTIRKQVVSRLGLSMKESISTTREDDHAILRSIYQQAQQQQNRKEKP